MTRSARCDRLFASALFATCLLAPAGGALRPEENVPLQHLVLVRFHESTPYAARDRVLREYERLARTRPGVRAFQWGTDSSPEGLAGGFTHGFVLTFENAAARDAFLADPGDEELVRETLPLLEEGGVFVFDLESSAAPPPAEPGRVPHLVFFKFQDGVDRGAVDAVVRSFATLPRQISGLIHYQAGPNAAPSEYAHLERGFDHAFLLTFANERARNDYLRHPAHQAFVEELRPVLAEPLVLDFTVVPSERALFITSGLEPYRVYQRNAGGVAALRFAGISREEGPVEARLRAGRRTVEGFDWRPAGEARGGRFEGVLEGVPVGGEYTVEVRRRDSLGNVAAHMEVMNILVGDLWILAGQSNMEGVGDLEGVEDPSPHVHCFTMAHRWELAVEPLHWLIDSPDPVHSGGRLKGLDEEGRRDARAAARRSRSKGAGLGLPFAKEYHRRTGVPVGLIASAHGGTSMRQWDPAGREQGGATLYGSMLKQVRNAGGEVKGVLWYQGESDANPEAAAEFAGRFRDLVAAFRRDLGVADLPFYYVQIGRFVIDRPSESWDRIRDLQRQAEAEIPNTAAVSVMDLPLDDLIHVGTEGLQRLGRRLAKIADRELFGNRILERGPRVASVRAESEGRVIRVEYSGVNGSLEPRRQIQGFSVRGPDGKSLELIFDAAVDPAAPASVILKLRSSLPPGAVLHYGAGLDPVCTLTDSEDMAALAAGPLAIER